VIASVTDFDKYMLRIVAEMSWVSRGKMGDRAKQFVVSEHNLIAPGHTLLDIGRQSPDDVAFIKTRVARLLKDCNFIYAPFGKRRDGQPRQNVPFAHVSLAKIIWSACYCVTPLQERHIFDPMPLSLVVLAATAMHAALDSYSLGYFKPRKFAEETYGVVYRRLFSSALKFQDPKDGSPLRCQALLQSFTGAMA